MSEQKYDPVERPEHYAGQKIEPIDAIEAWGLNYHLGNTVKYISRAGKKDPAKTLEDLKKGRWYLDRAISAMEKKEHAPVEKNRKRICSKCNREQWLTSMTNLKTKEDIGNWWRCMSCGLEEKEESCQH